MSTPVLLTTTLIDISYEHGIDFGNAYAQYDYFLGQPNSRLIQLNIPADEYRQEFEVDLPIDQVAMYDYCVISGPEYKYYYFITGRVQKGLMSTIYVELDVLSTYYFDMRFNESFVVRCHVPRWNTKGLPTPNYEDEGLEYGPMVVEKTEDVKKCRMNFVITASTPIGILKASSGGGGDSGGDGGGDSGGGGGGTLPTSGDWENGVPSKEMFRFLKGFEGFGPYLYNDSGGTPTIGYGITKSEPAIFDKLKASQPCSEELCAKEAWAILIKNYGKPIVSAFKRLGCTRQEQFDALLDLAYNGGTDLVINSGGNRELANIIKKDPNNESAIRSVWERYYVSDGIRPQPGLVARRKAECNMYFGKPYEVRTIPTIGSSGNVNGSFSGNGWLPT